MRYLGAAVAVCSVCFVAVHAIAESPMVGTSWQPTAYQVVIGYSEGAYPYIAFESSKGEFYALEYTDGPKCRGGTYDDLLAVVEQDADGFARMRAVPGREALCPNSTYICVDPDIRGTGDEPAEGTAGFCGAIVVLAPGQDL